VACNATKACAFPHDENSVCVMMMSNTVCVPAQARAGGRLHARNASPHARCRRGHRHASPHALAAGAAARRSTYTHYIAHAAHRPTGCAAPCSAGAHRCPPWRCSARAGVHPPAIPQGRSPAAPCECNSQSSCALHLASRHH
jgi:hypothetical protein